ncbi:flavoprotein [Streptomyces sp. ODS28]|uniref:flavoprotein n=1 Tax=Streptomyces sp. ODS28 TaxID=3136688 RepID=UPI0031E7FA8A
MSDGSTDDGRQVLGVVGTGAGGLEELRTGLVVPALDRGWRVAVTLTPTAYEWLRAVGELELLEELTGLPVRSTPRLPGEARPHPPVDCCVVAPASANTVAKLALSVSDNQALTQVHEAIGTLDVGVVLFPRINAAHARHPAWKQHVAALESAGVHVVQGNDVWPLYESREGAGGRPLPWDAILNTAATAMA